ncbi:hypothetical protein E3Q15_04499 [Wallemia mellicola]|nr:hypothetical protein E3Q15_04499 [Wallemia mellicola]
MHDITVHSSIALVPHIQQVTKDWQKKSGSPQEGPQVSQPCSSYVCANCVWCGGCHEHSHHGALQAMAQDYPQLGPPTEAYFVCTRKEESDKLPVDLGSILRCLIFKIFTFSNDLLVVFCNLKPNQTIHNRNLIACS